MKFKYQAFWVRIICFLIFWFALSAAMDLLFFDLLAFSRQTWIWSYLVVLISGMTAIYTFPHISKPFTSAGTFDPESRRIYLKTKVIDITELDDVEMGKKGVLGIKFAVLTLTCKDKRYTLRSEDLKGKGASQCTLWQLGEYLSERASNPKSNLKS